jgi:hypothetical protein
VIDFVLLLSAIGLLVLLVLLERLGSWLRLRRDLPEPTDTGMKRINHVLGSVLGLLALLMGFSFNMAVDRFERRNRDLIAEANAIGSAHDRLALLGTAEARALQADLRAYADLRLRLGQASGPAGSRHLLATAAAMRNDLKAAAVQAARPVAPTALANGVMSLMDDVADIGVARDAGLNARLPLGVLLMLLCFIGVAMTMTGYAYPVSVGERSRASLLLSSLLVVTLFLIIDLDRPFGGSVRINQAPLQSLLTGWPTSPPAIN